MCYSGEIVVPRPKIVKKLSKKWSKSCQKRCQKVVKKLSKSCKSCQKVNKKLSKKLSKSCQQVAKSCQKVRDRAGHEYCGNKPSRQLQPRWFQPRRQQGRGRDKKESSAGRQRRRRAGTSQHSTRRHRRRRRGRRPYPCAHRCRNTATTSSLGSSRCGPSSPTTSSRSRRRSRSTIAWNHGKQSGEYFNQDPRLFRRLARFHHCPAMSGHAHESKGHKQVVRQAGS
jgi:hypothetical protein